MSDQPATRKDGRKLFYDHLVPAEDEIEYIGRVSALDIPDDAIVCRRRPGDFDEAWVDNL